MYHQRKSAPYNEKVKIVCFSDRNRLNNRIKEIGMFMILLKITEVLRTIFFIFSLIWL